jgi:hypothetical protein
MDIHTPLYIACLSGHLEVVKYLLYYEVDLTNISLNKMFDIIRCRYD